MNRKVNGLVKAAASISLAGGILAVAAGPALAAAPNKSYAVAGGGVVTIGPLGEATYPGTSPVTLVNANVLGRVTTGVVTDTADATDASSTIANVAVTLTGLSTLSATAVSSSCSLNTNTAALTGTSTIVGGSISTPLGPITLTTNPGVNDNVVGLTGIATITLNQQITATDGTLTVNAIAITLLSGQTLTLGTSVCNPASLAPVSILPGMAMPIGLGALGLLALGGTGYLFSRRHRETAAA